MLRRIGKHVLLVSVPLFILLLISYRNHGHIVRRETQIYEATQLVAKWQQRIPVAVARPEPELPQWKVLTDGTVIHRGTQDQHRNYTLPINNPGLCANLSADQSSFVVVVESDIVNFEARQLIRDTWALSVMQTIANYRVVFLVGLTHDHEIQNKLEFENRIYEDIVQIAIYEGFQNLTHKSIHMLYWYTTFCSNAKFLFKTDDDIYLHIPNLMSMFASSTTLHDSILCHRNKSRKILRSLSDIHYFVYSVKNRNKKEVIQQIKTKFIKYLIGYDKLPGTLYPDYCSGFGYAMTHPVARKLLLASTKIPYIGIEDVFVTGFCRQKGNLTIVNSPHFKLKPFIHPIESKCAFENGRVTSNEMTVDDIKKLWTHINTQGYYCKLNGGTNK